MGRIGIYWGGNHQSTIRPPSPSNPNCAPQFIAIVAASPPQRLKHNNWILEAATAAEIWRVSFLRLSTQFYLLFSLRALLSPLSLAACKNSLKKCEEPQEGRIWIPHTMTIRGRVETVFLSVPNTKGPSSVHEAGQPHSGT
ncbi:hypothetical protein Ddc_02590 [Ditylenchus destructor]|nr:hypothetical protein Ddc_02590 [Ditylenchus destructor]